MKEKERKDKANKGRNKRNIKERMVRKNVRK